MVQTTLFRHLVLILLPFLGPIELSAAFEPCTQVIIRSEVKTGAAKYLQMGAGIVYSQNPESSSRNIVIPSHVIFGARNVVALCGNHAIPVSIRGQSVTADLAVGTVDSSHLIYLKPLFYSSGIGVITDNSENDPGAQTRILVPSLKPPIIKVIPVDEFSLYPLSFMKPIFGDHGAITLSSGVIPGMSGSALMINGLFAGLLTKSFANESLSAAVPASEVLSSIPILEKGLDPYRGRDFYLSSQLVENPGERKMSRIHKLHLKTESGWIEYRDNCESSPWSPTSSWIPEGGGWGEGGGPFRFTGSMNELIQGFDIPTLEETKTGRRAKPVAFYMAGKSTCAKEGVVNNRDAQRLVGLINYADEYGLPRTVRISSVDDLMPLAQIYGAKLVSLINQRGIFGDHRISPMTRICESESFKNFSTLQGIGPEKLQIFPSAEFQSLEASVFWLEHLNKVQVANQKSYSANGSELVCDRDGRKLRFTNFSKGSSLKFDLEISSQSISGVIEFGLCRTVIDDHKKDFWKAELSSPDMDWTLDIGVTIRSHGIFHLIPRRVSPHCFHSTASDSSKTKWRGFTWILD